MRRWEYRALITAFLLLLASLLVSAARMDNAVRSVSERNKGQRIITPEDKVVALTFDDGPKAGKTEKLLDGLKERNVRATFFMIGCQVQDNRDIVQRIFDEGHQIGIHTYDHVRLTELTEEEQKQQIRQTEGVIEGLIGDYDFLLRPPYGDRNETLLSWIDMPVVVWSIDTEDWTGRSADLIVEQTVQDVESGDIILMHDIFDNSIEAAFGIIDELQKMGYTFLTVEEMFEVRETPLENGEVYHHLW